MEIKLGLKNTLAFFRRLSQDDSTIGNEAKRNISALINVIPFVGSLIDANTVKRMDEHKLDEKLRYIDTKFEILLNEKDKDFSLALKDINSYLNTQENNNVISGINIKVNNENQELYDSIIGSIRKLKISLLDPGNETSSVIFLISGPSAVGKDCVINAVFDRLRNKEINCEFLIKYTNRKRKNSDLDYYRFLNQDKFNYLKETNSLIMYEYKYGNEYGFDLNHLKASAKNGTVLFAVYTDLRYNSFFKAVKEIQFQDFGVCPILFTAPLEVLQRRTKVRGLSADERITRMETAASDCKFIIDHYDNIEKQFPYIIANTDDSAINNTIESVYNIVLTNCMFNRVQSSKLNLNE